MIDERRLTAAQAEELMKAELARQKKWAVESEILRQSLQEWVNSLRSVSQCMKMHILRTRVEAFAEQWERDNPPPQPSQVVVPPRPPITGLN